MRGVLTVFLAAFLVPISVDGARATTELSEFVTSANAILCLGPGSLNEASRAQTAKSPERLRSLRCIRTESGIPLTVLERNAGVWKISFRPQGIPGGVTLWGRASSFTAPDGAPQAVPSGYLRSGYLGPR